MSNVPQLRFKEFSEEWEKNKLGNIFNITAGGDIKSEYVSNKKTNEFQYPIYANAEKDKGFYGYSNLYKISENVITVAGRGVNLGIAHARNHKFYPIVRLLVLNPKNDEDIYFFEYQINNLRLFIESTGVPQLTAPQISIYNILYPSKQEQEKIASFLSLVDTKIEQLASKAKLLQEYKKGVMQKIFSQEIRFKNDDDSCYPEWTEEKLGDVFKINAGGDISKENVSSNQNSIFKYPIYSNSDKNNGLYGYSDIYKIGDDCLTVTGRGTLGITIAREENFFPIVRLLVLIGKTKVNYKFFENAINSIRFFVESTGVPQLTGPQISSYKVAYPSYKEQTKIANFLSSIDSKIEQIQKQLDSTKEFKKALLQQMFV